MRVVPDRAHPTTNTGGSASNPCEFINTIGCRCRTALIGGEYRNPDCHIPLGFSDNRALTFPVPKGSYQSLCRRNQLLPSDTFQLAVVKSKSSPQNGALVRRKSRGNLAMGELTIAFDRLLHRHR